MDKESVLDEVYRQSSENPSSYKMDYSEGRSTQKEVTVPLDKLEVEILEQIGMDHRVCVNWKPLNASVDVRVWRKKNEVPKHRLDGEKVECSATGFIDTDLDNDVSYGYLICIQYVKGGRKYLSKGVTLMVTPVSKIKPLETFRVKENSSGDWDVSWKNPNVDSEVLLFYSKDAIPYQAGEVISLETVKKSLKAVTQLELEKNGCRMQIWDEPAMYYIMPTVTKQGLAVIGKSVLLSTFANFSIEEKRVVRKALYLMAEWPGDAEEILILYKEKKYPSGWNDSSAQRIRVTKENYQKEHAFVIPNIREAEYYLSFFALKDTDEGEYVPIYRDVFLNAAKKNIYYSIERTGFFNKKVSISFYSEEVTFQLPALQVRMLSGKDSAPINKMQGELLLKISEQNISGKYVLYLPMNQVGKNTGIRPFFEDDYMYDTYKLKAVSGTNYMIS